MENAKMRILENSKYIIVRDWMNEYKDNNTFYPIEKFITNYPKELEGSKVRISLGDDVDEVLEVI